MMKLALAALCACHPATTPTQPIAPIAPVDDAPSSSVWPAFPAITAAPASHPSGDPIQIPLYGPRVGETMREIGTSAFEIHYTFPTGSKYQRTETTTELRVKTLAAEGDRPTKLEVDTVTATESIALGETPDTATRDQGALLDGTYVVTPGTGDKFSRDQALVTRPGGKQVYGRDQEELASRFGPWLLHGRPPVRAIAATPLRLGEVIAIEPKAIGAELPGTYTLALVAAQPLTYEIDAVISREGALGHVESHEKMQLQFDRATGRLLQLHDAEHETTHESDRAIDDRFSTSETRFVQEPMN
jgi:hypothetical protein